MKNKNMIFFIALIIIVTIIIIILKNNINTNEKNNSDLDNIKNANIVYNEQTQMYDIYDKDGIYKQSVPKSTDLEIYEINPDYEAYDPGIY